MYQILKYMLVVKILLLSACSVVPEGPMNNQQDMDDAVIFNQAPSAVQQDLLSLPEPKGKVYVSVYSFRDQTGQYKEMPSSTFSSVITQGSSALLLESLLNSKWFVPVERENLQNLLMERKILRKSNKHNTGDVPSLIPASIMLEGGVIGYDSNIKTGGSGVKYLGIGASTQYRVDQVTVSLRAVDTISGQIINSVTATKTIYSNELSAGIFKFVKFKHLLEMESGYTKNQPILLCVKDAINSAVIQLVSTGIVKKHWFLADNKDLENPILTKYKSY